MLMRKKKKLFQAALRKLIGTSGVVIVRYERGDIKPSIDVVAKIVDALDVSVDYLIGKTNLILAKETIHRIVDISNLKEENKNFIFNLFFSQTVLS